MQYYFAPMEGITGYSYRKVWNRLFGDADKVFMPFLSPTQHGKFGSKTIKELKEEKTSGFCVIPQILANNAENFIWAAKDLASYGYDEINFNLGCPSGTVVPKRKGAGFLSVPDDLDRFFDEVFAALPGLNISVKTRLGMTDEAEFDRLLEIYNKYPIYELTVHARVRSDFYKEPVHMAAFGKAVSDAKVPLCYNGDIFTAGDAERFAAGYPLVPAVMIGRGLLTDPGLIRHIKTGQATTREQLRQFHDELVDELRLLLSGDVPVLHKMKEMWFYMGRMFVDEGRLIRNINKSRSVSEYIAAVDALFASAEFSTEEQRRF